MPIWGWACAVLAVALVALVVIGSIRGGREVQRIRTEGRAVDAYIVQANTALYQPGAGDSPAQALITFDARIRNTAGFLGDLARRVAELKGRRPSEGAKAEVAALVNDESYRPYTRYLLPEEFTGGYEVYSVHLWIVRRYLPGGVLALPYVRAIALELEPDTRVLMAPYEGEE